MGEEIQSSQFTQQDHERYREYLLKETDRLRRYFETGRFEAHGGVAGFELEAWLIDSLYRPVSGNDEFLSRFNNPLASPELASFNIEVNGTPRQLEGHVFSAMHNELNETWQACQQTAGQMDARVVMTGILPTVQNEDLNLANMSRMERYRALNREVVRTRRGKPIVLDINGNEHLKLTHRDVMLESAATSFQIHLQMNPAESVRLFNASIVLSAPLLAMSANSPYLFGKDLWDETRIPLFEQSVPVGGFDGAKFGPIRRVTFGSGYVRHSLMEFFEENLQHYPILLPVNLEHETQKFAHLRLHNGTIWRWNRPLVGFSDDGQVHLRLEQRVVPAGPTVVDEIANAAFFYGAVIALAEQEIPIESQLEFDKARDNFYKTAQLGLRATTCWANDKQVPVRELILKHLLPLSKLGLERLGVSNSDIRQYLDIIQQRVESGANGATWQRAWVKRHGRDMTDLAAAYVERQQTGEPVHTWTV
ncbi:MAG: glutamate-cysteine ligase family protein [Gammaproteobacteria bacterium]|nr:glutamate-cysteine ligase family protein [Gammaproteobacteria bacterium]